MTARTRRTLGSVAIVIYLLAYIILVVELSARLPPASWWAGLIFYPIAGIAWVFPLRPLMRWMTSVPTSNADETP